MAYKKIPMEPNKKIALVAYDNKKRDLVEWSTPAAVETPRSTARIPGKGPND